MERSTIINQLLSLSKKHLIHLTQEEWEEWEKTIKRKEALYKKLNQLQDLSFTKREENALLKIKKLEDQTRGLLKRKRDEIKQELERVRCIKEALKGYQNVTKKKTIGHFEFKC